MSALSGVGDYIVMTDDVQKFGLSEMTPLRINNISCPNEVPSISEYVSGNSPFIVVKIDFN